MFETYSVSGFLFHRNVFDILMSGQNFFVVGEICKMEI